MKPSDLLAALVAYCGNKQIYSTLCGIDKVCRKTPACAAGSAHSMIDFDTFEAQYCHLNGCPAIASSDGLTTNSADSTLFFVELKSWSRVMRNPKTGDEATAEAIDNKAQKYRESLQKKHDGSVAMCRAVVGDDAFDAIPLAVVFVTDIDTGRAPLSSIASNLNYLAGGASLADYCNSRMQSELKQITKVKVYYTDCRRFDSDIETFSNV